MGKAARECKYPTLLFHIEAFIVLDPFFYNNKLKELSTITTKCGEEMIEYLSSTTGEVDCNDLLGEVVLHHFML